MVTVFRRPYGAKIVAHRKYPEEIGFEPGLYTAGESNFEVLFFKRLDNDASQLFGKLKTTLGPVHLSEEDQSLCIRYLILANMRTPEDIDAMCDRMVRSVEQGIPELEEWFASDSASDWFAFRDTKKPCSFSEFAKIEYNLEDFREINLHALIQFLNHAKTMTYLMNHDVVVCSSDRAEIDFLTSDRPVVMEPGQILFPLSPRRLLALFRPGTSCDPQLRPSVCKKINRRIVSQAVSSVFTIDEKLRSFVEKHMATTAAIAPYLRNQ